MAIAKVILNGETLMDVTSNTVTSETLLSGQTAIGNNGEPVTGGLVGGPYYGIYKCLATRTYPLIASGSSSYGYTAEEVSAWCNSFSSYGDVTYRQFEGIDFSGSFYFNNLTRLGGYAFARGWTGNGFSDQGRADLYFPLLPSISDNTFCSNGNIRSVNAPNCTFIGSYAFSSCTNLSSISFPGCTSIQDSAFNYCYHLSILSFPQCTYVGSSCFKSCTFADIAYFPSCSFIGESAFYNCNRLVNINFSNCVSIGNNAFYACASLTELNFPICTNIGSNAFGTCSGITTINFPVCTNIGNTAFTRCGSLLEASFPNCSYVGYGAFSSCYSLTSVYLPNCTQVDNYAFYRCSSLSTINLVNCSSLSGGYTFKECIALKSINLPLLTILTSAIFQSCYSLSLAVFSALSKINNQVFWDCSALTSVYFLGSSIPTIDAPYWIFSGTPIYTSNITGSFGSIYVRASLYDSFKTANLWSAYSERFVSLTDSEIAALSFI